MLRTMLFVCAAGCLFGSGCVHRNCGCFVDGQFHGLSCGEAFANDPDREEKAIAAATADCKAINGTCLLYTSDAADE